MPSEPGPIARRWEALAAPLRFLIVFVISAPILWLVARHVPQPARGSRRLLRRLLGHRRRAHHAARHAHREDAARGTDRRRAATRSRAARLSVPDRPDELFVVVDDHGEPDRHGHASGLPRGSVARAPVDPRRRADARRRALAAARAVQGLGAEHLGPRLLGPRRGRRARRRVCLPRARPRRSASTWPRRISRSSRACAARSTARPS